MIIRYTKAEQAALHSIDETYRSQINDLLKSMNKSNIEEIKAEIRKLDKEAKAELLEKHEELENLRFSKISNSPKKVLDNAKLQTKAILDKLLSLVSTYEPLTEDDMQRELEKNLDKLETDEELLSIIEPLPFGFYDLIFDIKDTKGDVTKLSKKQITDFIKKDLRRHYEKIEPTERGNLDAFIEDAVSEALKGEPEQILEVPTAYFRVYHDKFIDNFQLMSNDRIQEVQETENKKRLYIEANGSIAEIRNWQDLNIQLGIPAHKLIMKALSLLTADTSHYTVVFSTKEFFKECGYKINNAATFNTYVTRTNECINTLRHVAVLENAGKNGGDWFIAGGKATAKWIRITFHPLYADDLISNNMITQFPKALLKMNGQKSNAYYLGCKMALHYFNKNNIVRESNICLKVETLLDSAEFPYIEDVRGQKASWIQKIRTPFETALDTLKKEGVISSWYYSKPKGKKLTPQEREFARSSYESWSRTLVCFKMKDAPDMSIEIEDYKKRKAARLARKKRKAVSEKQ